MSEQTGSGADVGGVETTGIGEGGADTDGLTTGGSELGTDSGGVGGGLTDDVHGAAEDAEDAIGRQAEDNADS